MKLALVAATAVLAIAAPASAGIVNGDFEQGPFATGWQKNYVVGGAAPRYGDFRPLEGDLFGYIRAGKGTDVYSTLSQTLELLAGDVLSGFVGFESRDEMPYNDDAYLSIDGLTLFAASVADFGAEGSTGWIPFSYTVPLSGSYTLQLGVANRLDNEIDYFASFAVIDAVQVSSAAPVSEPGTWPIMLLGCGLLGVAFRRRA